MRAYFTQALLLTVAFFLDAFASAMGYPFNLVSSITVLIGTGMFLFDVHALFFFALLGGLFEDYLTYSVVGFHSILYIVALTFVMGLRSTIITHQAGFSIFLLLLTFHGLYYVGLIVGAMQFSLSIFQETLIRTLLHTALSFLLLFIIKRLTAEIHKRFISNV